MKLVLGAIALLLAAPAQAQSKRYPPEPDDADDEQAQRSKLWDSAMNPQQSPYGALIAEAEALLRNRTTAPAREAVPKLDRAIALMPNEPKGYRVRGDAYLLLRDWARCAADLHTAWTRVPREPLDARQAIDLRRNLAACQARAGKLAEAERTLADVAVSGTALPIGDIWMRLGEVRIALGKLEEAIAALESAKEQSDAPLALVRWLLAGAYDRARRPAEAIAEARSAHGADGNFSTLRDGLPLLAPGDAEYLLGLAYRSIEQPRTDYALIYFRYFLKIAKDSPWRRRAEEHVRDLKAVELPELVVKTGDASLKGDDVRPLVRRAMPAMRACAARTPFVIYKVEITKHGPRTRERARFTLKPEGVGVEPTVALPSTGDVPQAERDTVVRCIEPIASRIAVPAIRDKDTHASFTFSVIAP